MATRKRNRQTQVRFPVFNNYEIRVIISRDVSRTVRAIDPEDKEHCVACHMPGDDAERRSYIILPLDVDEGTIAHECHHAVAHLFKWAGVRRDEENFAYHLDHLVGRIHKFLKR